MKDESTCATLLQNLFIYEKYEKSKKTTMPLDFNGMWYGKYYHWLPFHISYLYEVAYGILLVILPHYSLAFNLFLFMFFMLNKCVLLSACLCMKIMAPFCL